MRRLAGGCYFFKKTKNVVCEPFVKPNSVFGNLAIWPIIWCRDLTTEGREGTEEGKEKRANRKPETGNRRLEI